MKMETTLYAPYNGTVEKINTSIGDKVMPGEILVDIKKNEEQTDGEGGLK
jgi:biotin carboxyl carrier protein